MQLSLDCLTLTDASPEELVRSAAQAGFELVSLWPQSPTPYPRQLLQSGAADDLAAVLAETGVGVHHLEAFNLASREVLEATRPALELGARLGGKAILAYNSNPDSSEAAENLRVFVAIAGDYGLKVNVEPVSMGATRTPNEAQALIREACVDAGIVLDTLHLTRVGGTVADIRSLNPGLIRYVQVNDGLLALAPDDWLAEAAGERLYPGEGDFPLVEILRAVPTDVPWGIETPSLRRAAQGRSPAEQAMECMAAMRGLLEKL